LLLAVGTSQRDRKRHPETQKRFPRTVKHKSQSQKTKIGFAWFCSQSSTSCFGLGANTQNFNTTTSIMIVYKVMWNRNQQVFNKQTIQTPQVYNSKGG